MLRFRCFCALLLALGATACSDDGSGAKESELPEQVSAQVGEKGGTLKAEGITLEIPAGALDKNVKISVTNAGQSAPKEARAEQLSDVYEFGPAGTKFEKDVKVTFRAKTEDPKASVYFTKEDGSGFEKIESTKAGDEFTAYVKHFSQGFVGIPLDDDVDASVPAMDASAEEDGGSLELDAGDTDDGSEPIEVPDAEPESDAAPDDAGDTQPDAGSGGGDGGLQPDSQVPVADASADAEAGPPTAHIVVHSRDRFGLLVNQTWAAFQDGQGAWQPLPAPTATGVYEFDVQGGRFGVAFVCSAANFANSWNTITYAPASASTLDVVTQGPSCTAGTPPAAYTLQGTLGLGTDQYWRVGHAHQGGPALNFSTVPVDFAVGDMRHNEPNDVMFASGPSNASYSISRFLMRRDLTLMANTTGYNLDMVKDGITPLGTAQAQVLNANDATSVDVYYVTRGTGTGLWINTSTTSGSTTRAASFATIRETMPRRPTDRYLLVGVDQTSAQWRMASVATYTSGNLSVALPPVFATTFSALTAPYLRPVFGFTPVGSASAYKFDVSYSPLRNSIHLFTVDVQPGWLGGASTVSLTFPDFSAVSGFDTRWVAPSNGSVSTKAAMLSMSSSGGNDLKSESGQSATIPAL